MSSRLDLALFSLHCGWESAARGKAHFSGTVKAVPTISIIISKQGDSEFRLMIYSHTCTPNIPFSAAREKGIEWKKNEMSALSESRQPAELLIIPEDSSFEHLLFSPSGIFSLNALFGDDCKDVRLKLWNHMCAPPPSTPASPWLSVLRWGFRWWKVWCPLNLNTCTGSSSGSCQRICAQFIGKRQTAEIYLSYLRAK